MLRSSREEYGGRGSPRSDPRALRALLHAVPDENADQNCRRGDLRRRFSHSHHGHTADRNWTGSKALDAGGLLRPEVLRGKEKRTLSLINLHMLSLIN